MTKFHDKQNVFLFFVFCYGLSWAFWVPAVFFDQDTNAFSIKLFIYAGILGPFLASVSLLFLAEEKPERKKYWERLADFRRIRLTWYPLIFGIYPLLFIIALLIDADLFGHAQQFDIAVRLFDSPKSILPYSFSVLLLGPLPEELGWRGYALPRLQERYNAFYASLILGCGWTVWHLPLFFIEGSYHNMLGFGSSSYWIFCATAVLTSVLFTWIYNNNNQSTLSAVLFHFVLNYTLILFRISESVERIQLILLVFFTVWVVLIWTPHSLRGDPDFPNA